MAYRTILTIGNEKFYPLNYHNYFFYPHPWDKMFYSQRDIFEKIEDPLAIFGTWHKYKCWQNDLLEGYDPPSSFVQSFRPKAYLMGGAFTFTIESSGKEDTFESCMSSRTDYKIPLIHGQIEFYDGSDAFIPFQKLEFWDGVVCHLSESFCSTGNEPMLMTVTISAATLRINKSIVIQRNWWMTDINQEDAKPQEKAEPAIKRIYWKGKNAEYTSYVERKDIMLNHNIELIVEFSKYEQGDTVELTVKQSNGRRIKGQAKEFTISGTIDENGTMIIPNFKVECDFKEDNQDFGTIEFLYKDNKVDKLKENFGWTYIKEGGVTKIFVNMELQDSFVPKGCLVSDLKEAINNCYQRVLENSSGGTVTGKLFFSGTRTNELPQYVPLLRFGKEFETMGKTAVGRFSLGAIDVLTPLEEASDTLLDASESAVHELFHSLRLDHPFERTQSVDTKLFMNRDDKSKLTTALSTDPDIYYNIMNYNDVNINGKVLENLWRNKRPEYITKGQLKFIFEEIDRHKKGHGTTNNQECIITNGVTTFTVSLSDYYWEYGLPGEELDPLKYRTFKILETYTSKR